MLYIAILFLVFVGYLFYDYNKELPTIKWNHKLENDYKDIKPKKDWLFFMGKWKTTKEKRIEEYQTIGILAPPKSNKPNPNILPFARIFKRMNKNLDMALELVKKIENIEKKTL